MKSSNLGALQSFGLAAKESSSKRLRSNAFLDFPKDERKRRASHIFAGSNKSIGSFHNANLYGGAGPQNTGKGSIRRSFMDTFDVKGSRKGSINKKAKDKDGDNNSIGTDYSDDDMKDIEYHQRNKELYKTLKKIGVCVIPDPRIKTADKLPYFAIIQDDIREKQEEKDGSDSKKERRTSRKRKNENRDFDISHFKSIDFFSFLNAQAMMKNKKTKKSPSLQK